MIYLFVGVEDYLRTEGAKSVIDQHVPPTERDFALEIIDATCDKNDDVLEALNKLEEALYTESFFGGGKVVWLRDANFLPGSKIRGADNATAKEWFSTFLPAHPLPEGHHLIITAEKCLSTTTFYKWLTKNATIKSCGTEVRSYDTLRVGIERLNELLPPLGLTMPQPVKELFIGRVGIGMRTMMSELEKLRTYLGKQTAVTMEDVTTITSIAANAEPFDISDIILTRAAAKIVPTVELLRADKNSAFAAATIILSTLNDLCALRDAIDRGWFVGGKWDIPLEQVPLKLKRLTGFMAKKYAEGAMRYSLNELRAARHYAIEMRFRMVDSSQDTWNIIEPVLLRIVARTR